LDDVKDYYKINDAGAGILQAIFIIGLYQQQHRHPHSVFFYSSYILGVYFISDNILGIKTQYVDHDPLL